MTLWLHTITLCLLVASRVSAQPQYIDNTDQIISKVNLADYKDLLDHVALNNHRQLKRSGKLKDISEQAIDDRLFLGEAESHTKENCFILKLLQGVDGDTLHKLCQLFHNLDEIKLKHQLEGLQSVVVCFKENTLPSKLLRSIKGLELIERDRVFKSSEPKVEQQSDSSAVNRLSFDHGATPFSFTGKGVNVYVVDSGIETQHPEFEGRARLGYSIFGDSIGPDCSGHGTSVASCIGGKSIGVAPKVNLIAVQVLDCSGSGSTSGMLNAVEWLRKNAKRPCVVNMSFVGARSPSLDYALSELIGSGIAVTIAAGNYNRDAGTFSPNGSPKGALAIGATDSGNKRAPFSNYGDTVALLAPGSRVPVAIAGGGYGTESGTSFSAPLAAGACAMILEQIPTMPADDLERVIKKIGIHGELESLNGCPNIFLQVPFAVISKAEYGKMETNDERIATYSSFIISPTPFGFKRNSSDTTTTSTTPVDHNNTSASFRDNPFASHVFLLATFLSIFVFSWL